MGSPRGSERCLGKDMSRDTTGATDPSSGSDRPPMKPPCSPGSEAHADPLLLEVERERLSEELSALSRRLQVLEGDREFLLLHTKNLERAARELAHANAAANARIRELEVSWRSRAVWRLLTPVRVIRRAARRLRAELARLRRQHLARRRQ